MVPYFDAYVQEKFNPQILQWQWYQKKDDGYGLFSCNKPDISLSLSVVPSQFNQMLPKGGFFSTHLHTVSKASWVYHVFPSIRGFLFDSTVQYLFWVDKGKIGWLIQQRFPFIMSKFSRKKLTHYDEKFRKC